METPWRKEADGVRIFVHVQPGAKREGAVGLHGGALKIAVRARAKEGEANEALVKWLAKELGITRRDIEILHGAKSRKKTVFVLGDPESIEKSLNSIISSLSSSIRPSFS